MPDRRPTSPRFAFLVVSVCATAASGQGQTKFELENPSVYVDEGDGTKRHLTSGTSISVAAMTCAVLGVDVMALRGDRELWAETLDGDVTIRQTDDRDTLVRELEAAIIEQTNPQVRLTRETRTVPVYVASGVWDPAGESADERFGNPCIIVGDSAREPEAKVIARRMTSPDGFLRSLGQTVGRPVVTEKPIGVRQQYGFEFYDAPMKDSLKFPFDGSVRDPDRVLGAVTRQTGLTFESGVREMELFILKSVVDE